MFTKSQARWLVTTVGAVALLLVMAAPAGAWADVEGGRMDGNGQGSMPPLEVQKSQIHTNVAHEGKLAELRVATATAGDTYIPGVTDSTTGVMQQVAANTREQAFTRPDSSAGTTSVPPELPNRDYVVADKAAPAAPVIPYLSQGQGVASDFGETYIPGVTDSGTGVLTDIGANVETPVVTAAVSDDGFNWTSDSVIGISAALLTALLMALGAFALVNQRRRRMVL
jgi:hypothetical protein